MDYANIEWRDGQPYSPDFDDIYYSSAGSREEAEYVFLKNNRVSERFRCKDRFVIAETGFGFGLNFVLTLRAWQQYAKADASFHYIGIEKHPVSPDDIRRLSENWPDLAVYFEELLTVYPSPVEGHHARTLFNGRIHLHLIFMDVVEALEQSQFNVDAWYLDGFSPKNNPDLWSVQVFGLVAQNSKKDATLSTYSSAGLVKRGLISAGFDVKKVTGYGSKREMITAIATHNKSYRQGLPWFEVPLTRPKNRSALVIGAGLAGLSVAAALVKRGWKVTVIDKHGEVAQEASGNPAGLVLPRLSIDNKTDSIFYTNAFLYAVNQLDSMQKQSKDKFWFKSGVYSLMDEGKSKKIINKNNFSSAFITSLTAADAADVLNEHTGGSIFFPDGGWAIPSQICAAIIRMAGNGIRLSSFEVDDIFRDGDLWVVKDKNGSSTESAEIAIIANGNEVNTFDVTSWLPISSARGQITMLPENEKSHKIEHAMSFDGYVTPAHNGYHCTGASYAVDDNNRDLTYQDQNENMVRLSRYFPDVFNTPDNIEGRVGFRPVSNDRVPVVGAVPDKNAFLRLYKDLHQGKPVERYQNGEYLPGLYVSAAHGSRGMCSCFLSAEIIAAMAEDSILPVSKAVADYINPARFIVRRLKRNLLIC